jgi:hypothetical protein
VTVLLALVFLALKGTSSLSSLVHVMVLCLLQPFKSMILLPPNS